MNKQTKKWLQIKLRELTLKWSGRNECLKRYKHKELIGTYKNGKEKFKVKYQCAHCHELFNIEEVQVDHIIEVGKEDVPIGEWIEKLYCSVDNLQVLCVHCHLRKSRGFIKNLRIGRKVC